MRLLPLAAGLLAVAVARNARADDGAWLAPVDAVRVSGSAGYGLADFARTQTSPMERPGLMFDVQLRVHAYSPHGVVFGVAEGGELFGPDVKIVEAGYSLRLLGSRDLRGATGALYFDVGPVLGVVTDAEPAADHATFGVRTAITGDVHLWNLLVGATLAYRGGVPLSGEPDPWEQAVSATLHAGLVFDLGRRSQ